MESIKRRAEVTMFFRSGSRHLIVNQILVRVFLISSIWQGQKEEVSLNKQIRTHLNSVTQSMIDLKQITIERGQDAVRRDTLSKDLPNKMILNPTRKWELTYSQTRLRDGHMPKATIIEISHLC